MLEIILTAISLCAIIFTNVFLLLAAPARLGRDLLYDGDRLRIAAIIYIPQILAALALWYYSEMDNRTLVALPLWIVPASSIIYSLLRFRKLDEYGPVHMWIDIAGSLVCLGMLLELVA